MISVNQVSIHFTGTDLFSNVSLQIGERDRIGLVGRNGSGKTTLLRILAGELIPQEGEVVIPSGTTLGFLPQELKTGSLKTVREEAMLAFSEVRELEHQVLEYSRLLSERDDYDTPEYHRLIELLTDSQERLSILGGQTAEAQLERVLTGLGFEREELDNPVSSFSAGFQMRVELSRILLRQPDIILLDEPTNHLDIESIQWLEDYLGEYRGALVLVSHDRAFLDNVTHRTVEISMSRVYDYKASYSAFVSMREERLESQMNAFNNQQRQIRQIERFVERFRYKATKARQVQSRIRMLEKMDDIEFEEIDQSAIRFRFPPAPRSGKVLVEGINLGKSYGDKKVLQHLNFSVIRGDRIAFVGRNGEGKTTLSRIIRGDMEHTGVLKYGHNVRIGYYSQTMEDTLDGDMTVFDTLDSVAAGDIRKHLRTILGAFLFSEEDIDKKVRVLSGGEKSRLCLALLLLNPVNLLILDEPTNHLDMTSKDILKKALLEYDGTLIVVSHDRDFLQGLTHKVFEFRKRHLREYLGDIYDFLEARRLRSLRELETQPAAPWQEKSRPDKQAARELKKQLDRDIRRVSRKIEETEAEINRLESEISRLNAMLSDPGTHADQLTDGAIYREYETIRQTNEEKMRSWEGWLAELERLEQQRSQLE
ncbi:MAG: ABC-F family ATP-binding cassette domain-containing protein [Bacteroidales bacterium]|nr:ABC-F family ATP-binding cassette domain-containing protein [Bacteroidales bacterium]